MVVHITPLPTHKKNFNSENKKRQKIKKHIDNTWTSIYNGIAKEMEGMKIVLKDGRELQICRLGFYEVVKIGDELYYNFIGRPDIRLEDIERVE